MGLSGPVKGVFLLQDGGRIFKKWGVGLLIIFGRKLGMGFKLYSSMMSGLVIKVLRWFFLDCFVLLQISFLGWAIMVYGGAMPRGGKSEESMAQNLYDLIRHHSCKRGIIDRWRWGLDSSGEYVVRTSYLAQLNHQQSPIGEELKNCWINCVSLNICCFVWKLVRRRLPTKDELFKRNVIVRVDEMMCIFCNNHVETIDHLFSSCDFVVSFLKGFYSWLKISVINPCSVLDLKFHMNPSEVVVVQSCGECFGSQWFGQFGL
ncbi:hypothetical protein Lal_00050238 [Lupinus albus]|nr:hypothetical protein Lal_00050238 [Lupinus albus]